MRVQRQSDTFKYGDSAEQPSKDRVVQFWIANTKYVDWYIDLEWIEHYSPDFIRRNPDRTRVFMGHEPDICFWTWVHSEISLSEQPVPKLIIEIDGKSHSSKERQMRDGVFNQWIAEKYKGYVQVIRLDPVEIMGEKEDSDIYLRQQLSEYLK
jgi:hypothetical protein